MRKALSTLDPACQLWSMLSKNYSTDAGNLEAECFGRLEVKHKFKLRQFSAGSSRFCTVLSSKIVSERWELRRCPDRAAFAQPFPKVLDSHRGYSSRRK